MKPVNDHKKAAAPALLVTAVLAVISLTAEMTPPALAQEATQPTQADHVADAGGAERLDAADHLRTLSQRMAVEACNIYVGNEVEVYRKAAEETVAEFNRLLNALESGDEALHIMGPEKKHKALEAIANIRAEWAPLEKALGTMIDGSDIEGGMKIIAERNEELLKLTQKLVTVISAEYANPAEMLLSDALLIDIAGRQAMLAEMIEKDVCAIIYDIPIMGNAEELQKSLALFEKSHAALREGNDTVGINPPPTPEIAAALDEVWAVWQDTRPLAEKATGPHSVDDATFTELEHHLEDIYAKMTTITVLYDEASKLGI